MILYARASKIIDLCCPRESKNQCFGLPGHAKSLILHAKASAIIDFACPGELPNASFWLPWRGCCFGVGGRCVGGGMVVVCGGVGGDGGSHGVRRLTAHIIYDLVVRSGF